MKKLLVLLVHGTWGSAADWKNANSKFQQDVKVAMSSRYGAVLFESISWSGWNRWAERSKVSDFLRQHLLDRGKYNLGEWDYVVIAHSHGGNIATAATREVLQDKPDFPILGVVCLNTPFLKNEIRASASYLVVWLALCLGFIAALNMLPTGEPLITASRVLSAVSARTGSPMSTANLTVALVVPIVLLGALLLLSKRLSTRKARDDAGSWGPRPRVLCLSCPDDEAITALGLIEGIANLPQLLLHPIGVLVSGAVIALTLIFDHQFYWCANDLSCWSQQLSVASFAFTTYVLVALAGGVLGTATLIVSFGLGFRLALESFVSRVLVSYSPLNPADAHFRGISDIVFKWFNPLQLIHSQIYRSPRTTADICYWLSNHARPVAVP